MPKSGHRKLTPATRHLKYTSVGVGLNYTSQHGGILKAPVGPYFCPIKRHQSPYMGLHVELQGSWGVSELARHLAVGFAPRGRLIHRVINDCCSIWYDSR